MEKSLRRKAPVKLLLLRQRLAGGRVTGKDLKEPSVMRLPVPKRPGNRGGTKQQQHGRVHHRRVHHGYVHLPPPKKKPKRTHMHLLHASKDI